MTETGSAPTHEALVRLLLESGAVRFGDFVLASGQRSDVYVDIKRVWTDPARLAVLAQGLAAHVGPADRLAGMELGAIPLVVATALATGKPYVVVRKAAKAHGTQQRLEGEVPERSHVTVVEDVTTTGGSVVDTVNVVREAGGVVDTVVTVVDRESGAGARLEGIRVKLVALATLRELRGARE